MPAFPDISMLFKDPNLNKNIKSVLPDGTVNFYDDAALMQSAVSGIDPAGELSIPNVSPPVRQNANIVPGGNGVTPGTSPVSGDGAQPAGFFKSAAFPLLLAQLGSAFSASDPKSWQAQLSNVIGQRSQSQLYTQLLSGLSQQAVSGNPVNPSAALQPFEVAGLSPDMISSAVQFAEGAKRADIDAQLASRGLDLRTVMGLRDVQSADVNDAFTMAKTIAALQPDPVHGDFKVVDLGVTPDGKQLPPGQAHRYRVNMQSGQVETLGSAPIDKDKDGGAGKKPSQSSSTVNMFRETLLTQFVPQIQEGLDTLGGLTDPKSGQKITDAGTLLSMLKDPQSAFFGDSGPMEALLAQVPDAFSEYNKRLESALIRIDADENSGTILRDLRKESFTRDKKRIPGFGGTK